MLDIPFKVQKRQNKDMEMPWWNPVFQSYKTEFHKKVFTLKNSKRTTAKDSPKKTKESNYQVKAQWQTTKKSRKANVRNNNYLLCYIKINEIKLQSAFREGWILGNSESEFTRKLSNAAKSTLKSAHQLGLKCEIYTCQWLFQDITESILRAIWKYLVNKWIYIPFNEFYL